MNDETSTEPKPCKYCGFVAARESDEDCPDKPKPITPTIEEMRNATPEAMRKLATLILHRSPLQPSAVAEALETCAYSWASALEQLEAARTDLATVGFQLVEDAEIMSLGAFRANAGRCVPILKKQFGEEWWKFDGLLDKEPPAPEVKE